MLRTAKIITRVRPTTLALNEIGSGEWLTKAIEKKVINRRNPEPIMRFENVGVMTPATRSPIPGKTNKFGKNAKAKARWDLAFLLCPKREK